MLWGGAFRRRSYGHARVRFGQTRVVAALQPEGLYALCAGARRCRLRECATLSLARVRDAVACAGARRYRLRECFGRDAFVVVRTCTLACALSRRALLLTARWLYAPWGEFATLPLARVRDAAACADARRCRLRGCATLPLARMGNANACAGARRYRLRGWATLSLARVRDAAACASARRFRLRGCAVLPHARMRDATACAGARRCRLRGCAYGTSLSFVSLGRASFACVNALAPIGALRYRLRARTARRCRLCRWGVRIMMYCISLLRCIALTLRERIRTTRRRLSLLRYDAPHLAGIRALDDILPARDSCGQFQYLRSSVRYCTASEMCSAAISSAPARSAIVRATFRMRV